MNRCLLPLMVLLLASCASNQSGSATSRDMQAGQTKRERNGYLKVYSATQTRIIGKETYFYPHTGYTIQDLNGVFVKYVPNHVGYMDNMPSIVPVPAGRYQLRAESDWYGRATFPVEVKPGRMLVIHLERDGNQPKQKDDPRNIRLPDGRFIGWYE